MRSVIIAVALLLAASAPLSAGLLEHDSYGAQNYATGAAGQVANARGISQAGAGHLANPALAALASPCEARASFQAAWRRETRNREVFDSYSNSVGLNTESVNSEVHVYLKDLSLGYARRIGPLPAVGIGLGLAAEYDFNYAYHRETRDGFFRVIRTDDVTGKGRIYGVTGSLACRPVRYVAAGIGITRLTGSQTVDRTVLLEDPLLDDTTASASSEYSGTRANLGLWGPVTERLSWGFSLRTAATMTADVDLTLADTSYTAPRKVRYPGEYAAAVTYRPAHTFPATVTLEYARIPWDKLTDDLAPGQHLQAVNRYSMSVAHTMADAVPLRFGISFANSYLSTGIGLASAGMGADLTLWKTTAQIAASVGKRTYNLGQAYGTSDVTNVSETVADLVLTFSLR